MNNHEPRTPDRYIHLFSGGLDSTVLLYDIIDRGDSVECLLCNYNQRHAKELDFAQATCVKLGVKYSVLQLPHQLFTRSALAGRALKVDELSGSSTVVPNRNMVFISMATSYALSTGANMVSWAVNLDDSKVYPDCRLAFYNQIRFAIEKCDNTLVLLRAPFLSKTKAEVVALGKSLGVPFDETWSCYAGNETPCGECGACKSRQEALQ